MKNVSHPENMEYPALKNTTYIRLQAGFGEWMRILNFEKESQQSMPKLLTGFLCFLERQDCHQVSRVQETQISAYLEELQDKTGRNGQALSLNYVRKHLQVIRKFSRYLAETGQESFTASLKIKGKSTNIKSILTLQEIGGLYNAVQDNTLGLRDKAMLALYYGCGLRKQEGISLNTVDLLLDKNLIHVRKGKGYKARFVPISGQQKTDLENYLNYGRPYLQNLHKKEEALLLSIRGRRISGATAFERIQNLKTIAAIAKPIGLHTLRHSIATHLLKSGMKLEQIQRLLGHSSMESTQIYTHITHEATL